MKSEKEIESQREIVQGYYSKIFYEKPNIETILQWLESDLEHLRGDDAVSIVDKIVNESPSTEVGQQGVESLQKIISNYFKVKPIDYYFGLDSYDLAEHLFASIKTLESQPQEVGQDELWDEVSDKFQSWIDNDFDERAASDVTEQELKPKFTLIKK